MPSKGETIARLKRIVKYLRHSELAALQGNNFALGDWYAFGRYRVDLQLQWELGITMQPAADKLRGMQLAHPGHK